MTTDRAIWTDAELLRWWHDGYRELLAFSGAVRRIRLMDIPGRHAYTITYEWEDRHTTGTVRKPSRTIAAGYAQGTTLWEAEHFAGVSTSASLEGYTYEWERAHIGETDRHYRFTFHRHHEHIVKLMWNHRNLVPVSVRELDESDDEWWKRTGEPRWWTTGTGRVTSVEVYEIVTDYSQSYELQEAEAGIPRQLSGDRTYETVRLDGGPTDAPYGTIRSIVSTERQYLPQTTDPTSLPFAGIVRDWKSSVDSLLVIEVVVPDVDLTVTDVPTMLPSQLYKYVDYYVLYRAHSRAGEGHDTMLADHYLRRFQRGVALARRLGDIAHKDRLYRREEVVPSGRRIQRVSLPSDFPAVW